MKRTIPTLAVLMAATLFAATVASAQSTAATNAYPPGPSAQAYPPGPTGQATASTSNVNVVNTPGVSVVNTPTVMVGNEVTIKEPSRQPLYAQKRTQLVAGTLFGATQTVSAPAGSRMVIENISLSCTSATPQPLAVSIYRPGLTENIITLAPPPLPWGSGTFSVETIPVHLLVDDSLSHVVYRPTGSGLTDCAVTFIGYSTPLP